MIEVKNISKSFNDVKVLKDITVTLEAGKINLIIGRSGAGKSVLLKSLVGLHDVDEGEIVYDGRVFEKLKLKEKKQVRKEIGMVFQGGALFDSSTVLQNVIFPLNMFTKMNKKEKLERAMFCLEKVHLHDVDNRFPSEISGGMQKRVAIARAIALNPKYLFCDEPNSGLDPKTSIVIDNLIKEITEEFNITTIVNTHDMNSVMEIGDKIIFIHEGSKWWEGDKNQIFKSDNQELNDFVFASKLYQRVKAATLI